MSSFKDLPRNDNYLAPNGFRFVISRLPSTTYFCTSVDIPDVDIGEIGTPTPFVKLNFAASAPEFSALTIRFLIDEDMSNYNEILKWILGLGFPEDFYQYRQVADKTGNKGVRSDATLVITTSSMNPNREIYFRDIFPVKLSGPQLYTTADNEINYVEATAVFSIRDFILNDEAGALLG